jgi:hypothetical protein
MIAARRLEPTSAVESFAEDEDRPLYTFDDAPLGEPLSDEERCLLEEAEEDLHAGQTVPHSVVRTALDRCAQAMKRFGAAGENADVTVGEILRWLDTGEPSPAIAALMAAEGDAAAE